MTRKRVRYSIHKAIAWAEKIRLALEEGTPVPFEVRIPGYDGQHRSAAFAHWTEYAYRALEAAHVADSWLDLFTTFRIADTIENEFYCMESVLRCVQREQEGTLGKLTKDHLLAAEIFGYSFANYRDHLGIGHVRYEDLMPNDAKLLRRAVNENWPLTKVAKTLKVDSDDAADLVEGANQAIAVVDASTPAESFRVAIRQLVQEASEAGLNSAQDVERLVTQICYRVSDLSCLLQEHDQTLSDYCQDLRQEPELDDDDDEMQEE